MRKTTTRKSPNKKKTKALEESEDEEQNFEMVKRDMPQSFVSQRKAEDSDNSSVVS
jgi:hypothetical protein